MSISTADSGLFQFNTDGFDFNLQFEQLFFSIIPSALFIPTSLWRSVFQARKPSVVNARGFQFLKMTAIAVYCFLELALLVLSARGTLTRSPICIASSVLNLVSAFCMLTLSVIDHSRCPRPSVLLNSYLLITVLFDGAQTRTLLLSSTARGQTIYSGIFCAAIALKACVLILEARQKTKWLTWDTKGHSPEETSGIFSLGVFFWLNRLFLTGYKTVLRIESLYPLDSSLRSEVLHGNFVKRIEYSKLKADKYGLLKVLVRALKVPLLLPIAPRLALVGFTFCQPLFIERLLDHLSQEDPDPNVGYGLIGASILIYAGIALSRALCWYFHHRFRTAVRSILVTETFAAATRARLGSNDDSAAVTLMSTDIERIIVGLRSLHEAWASTAQAGLAALMLYWQLGAAFAAPIGVVTACFIGLGILVRYTGDSQRAWMSVVQRRVGLTATVISSMKSLRISGLSAAVSDYVQQLRVDELVAGARFRSIVIIAALFAYLPDIFSPPLALAFTTRTLDASTVFTSLSYLTLLTSPLSQLFQAVPEIVSALTCLGRIQRFLEAERYNDFRQVAVSSPDRSPDTDTNHSSGDCIVVKDGSFGWKAEKHILHGLNTRILAASLTMVIGPVGSGKSTFCKALLGEIPFSSGTVTLSTQPAHVGFCEQTPFLWNGSVRDNIIGYMSFHPERYAEVLEATALSFDLLALPQGDETNIGSDGVSLSGGQKQRVSLARALYLRSQLLVLDGVFSGLDADTEEQVFRGVFGIEGLLRRWGATVVLCTHSVKHLPAADYIIALESGVIVEQGTFDTLSARSGYVQRLALKQRSDADTTKPSNQAKQGHERSMPAKQTLLTLPPAATEPELDAARQVGDGTVYKHYVRSMGWFVAGCSLLFAALWGFFKNFPTIWLTYWTDAAVSNYPSHTRAHYAGIYAMLQTCALISLFLLAITLFVVSVKKAGANLHKQALRTLIRAPLIFFSNTDTGVITNLFSQDLNLIDTELPEATLNTLFSVFLCLGQAAVMLTSSAYLGISYPLLAGLLYAVQKFYLRTSRQLRLLDLEAKSPLYTHFLDTLKGLATLRAFGLLQNDIHKNLQLVDSSQRAAYLLLMIQEWLSLVLNLVVMVIAAVLTALAVGMQSSSAFAGASLYSLMSLGANLSGIVIYYTRLETSIGAIARLKAFNETVTSEDREGEDIVPDESWPARGMVEVRGVSAQYETKNDTPNPETALALNNITLTVRPGEKVAICGRTGSGKSTLLALLLKLIDPLPLTTTTPRTATDNRRIESQILIDNIPLDKIDRHTLRQRLIALPQDSVFLPDGSTFRANLDPSQCAIAEDCQAIIESIGLWPFVQDRGGIDAGMSAGTLSAGQKQLFSLGRALVRQRLRSRTSASVSVSASSPAGFGGILLLDEVSASVDRETEKIMQRIIQTEFRNYTVIAVSHRLEMVIDFDTVVVMDQGSVVEVGNPGVLKEVPGSRFGELVRAGNY
ncbi:P-loop containing nucleoside triphosphate hydrolase protein [Aspergillus pseudoustus]|uniref:P-loop containing nucleoside triphosphate hydrolase protein n=1 Tax=Aspergillus pseudoustus TaxID=1810923 RepID=A0ABR4JZ03_9EURO